MTLRKYLLNNHAAAKFRDDVDFWRIYGGVKGKVQFGDITQHVSQTEFNTRSSQQSETTVYACS